MDLIKKSLELRRQELPINSITAAELKEELQIVQSASPVPVAYTSLQPFRPSNNGRLYANSSVSRCAAVTGKLEVRLCNINIRISLKYRANPGNFIEN